jgi:hypothetical protein
LRPAAGSTPNAHEHIRLGQVVQQLQSVAVDLDLQRRNQAAESKTRADGVFEVQGFAPTAVGGIPLAAMRVE